MSSSGTLTCWGSNRGGEGTTPDDLFPAKDLSLLDFGSCALSESGQTRCWWHSSHTAWYGTPLNPSDLPPAKYISATASNACIITFEDYVRCWGDNYYGQSSVPSDLGKVSLLSAGHVHVCAADMNGMVRCWGANADGQSSVPSDLGPVKALSSSFYHTCAITLQGEARCWGNNTYGQSSVPADLGPVEQINSIGWHTCAITTSHKVRCWGSNDHGQSTVPESLTNVRQISLGIIHTCALTDFDVVQCWGENGDGKATPPVELGFSNPQIEGISQVGSVLKAIVSEATVELKYQWLRDGVAIESASGETYLLTEEDYAKRISLQVTGKRLGSADSTKTTSELLISRVPLTTFTKGGPKVLGSNTVGSQLQALVAGYPFGTSFDLQWLRDGVEINGATENKYTSTLSDIGHTLTIRVTRALEGYETSTVVSEPLTIATPLSEMGNKNWPRVSSNADGTQLAAIAGDRTIWASYDSGANWVKRTGAGITSTGQVLPEGDRSWQRVASSTDGQKLAAVVYNGSVWTSSDAGLTWTERAASGARLWSDIASSSDGTKLVALAYPGGVWTSNDSGLTWTERVNAGYRNWGAVASNADGSVIVASWNDGNISVSHDSGNTWTVSSIPSNFGWWRALASNADGSRLYGVEWCGGIWESKDSGSTWSRNESFPTKTWYSIATNEDGSKILAGSWADSCWGQPTDGKLSLATSLNKFTQTGTATIQGSGYIGSVVKAQVGTYPTGTSFSYQWLRDGVAISGATDSQFVIREQDFGHNISYQLTATKSGYELSNLTSSSLEISKKGLTKLSSPVILGKATVGRVISASISMSSGLDYTYQWLRDGVPIEGAVTRKYVLTDSDANTTITFRVCGTKQEFETACLVRNSGQVALGEMSRRPYVVMKWPTAKVGATIQGRPGDWDSDVSLSYSWLRDGVFIPGENQSSYQITATDRGHSITFRVLAQKTGYKDVVRTSASKLIP